MKSLEVPWEAVGNGRQTPPIPTTPARPGIAFASALNAFRNKLTGQQLSDFGNTTYDQLCREVIRIQCEQEKLMSLMDLSRLQSFLEAMHNFSKIVELFLNVSDVVAFIWGPIKFILLTASNWADSFEAIVEAYEHIGEQLPLLPVYESIFHENPHLIDALQRMYLDILEFHQNAIRFLSGKDKVWRRIFKSTWKDFGTRFGGILKSLRRHKELVESSASLAQYHRYQEDMSGLKSDIEALVREERNKKMRSVKEWLATGSQAQTDHERFLDVRREYPATGNWILEHESIVNWMTADVPTTPIVWMTGIPGAGKTILASVIIEECKQRKGFLTTYFYCNCDGPGNNSAVAVIRGLLEQIVDQAPYLLPHCHNKYLTSGEPSLRSPTLAKAILKDVCPAIDKQYIIIDGIDEFELPERKQILEFFVNLVGECDVDEPGKLRVLFVSQDYPDIRRALHSSIISRIVPKLLPLSSADNENDIRIYVTDLAAQIKAKFSLDDNQERVLRDLTVARARGMFLYAKLVLSNLLRQPTRERLIEEIKTERFPNGLEEAYERILSRIKITSGVEEWEQAKRLLGWMVCAKRQLTWREMQVALSLDFDSQEVLYDDRKLRRHIHDICGSLVQLSGDRVQLVHSTAKFYITRCTRDIHEPSVECELAAMCLQYLTFPCFSGGKEVDDEMLRQHALEGKLGFQDYAVAKWYHHVNAFIDSGEALLKSDVGVTSLLQEISVALDDFVSSYDEENWDDCVVVNCTERCKIFENEDFYHNLIVVAGHIYAFQKKGFDARHVISIKSLATALERNRSLLEELPKKLSTTELAQYRQFYDEERRFKCTKITCVYFFEGFKDAKSRKRHINLHDRPFQCEVSDCLAAEYGYTNSKDLEKHIRATHPELTDLAETFKPSGPPRAKSQWSCSICGKSFTRSLHQRDHEKSHRGERPYECPECGKAFTRKNDCKRHQKLHDRR